MKTAQRCNGIFAIQNDAGHDAPAYYQTESQAATDMLNIPKGVRAAFEAGPGQPTDNMVVQYFNGRGTIPFSAARRAIFREMWRPYQVQATSVADFLERYYKPDRYHGRGEEYAVVLLASHEADFACDGFDIISHYDSTTGQYVAYFGDK